MSWHLSDGQPKHKLILIHNTNLFTWFGLYCISLFLVYISWYYYSGGSMYNYFSAELYILVSPWLTLTKMAYSHAFTLTYQHFIFFFTSQLDSKCNYACIIYKYTETYVSYFYMLILCISALSWNTQESQHRNHNIAQLWQACSTCSFTCDHGARNGA